MIQQIHRGFDSLAHLHTFLEDAGASRILLVAGRHGYEKSGAAEALAPIFRRLQVERHADFAPNPQVGELRSALRRLKSAGRPDVIVAVGGGSAMDYAKLFKAFWTSADPMRAWQAKFEPLTPAAMPLVAIPTTAGSGSESTHFAVLYDGVEKFSLAHVGLFPDQVFLVAEFLTSLPGKTLAASGMDALGQAVESFWSIHATDASRDLARRALRLCWENLPVAVQHRDTTALAAQLEAANLAGQAINLTRTTAPHAVSYPLTALFGVPHGQAVGLLVPRFLEFNAAVTASDCLHPHGPDFVRDSIAEIASLIGADSARAAREKIEAFAAGIGLPSGLRQFGVHGEAEISQIIANGFNPERVNNNPRRLDPAALGKILREML